MPPRARVTAEHLAPAVEKALEALERAGVPRDHVVLGVTADREHNTDTAYETHVGAAYSVDLASMLDHVARDLERDAHAAAVWLSSPTRCPECRSPRYVLRQRVQIPWLYSHHECLDCGHRSEERKGT